MYDRNVNDQLLTFEASGALYHNALVMQDSETDSFWALMTSSAIGGPLQANTLQELPLAVKLTWGEWRNRHPHTLVLQHKGETHVQNNPYDNYFHSEKTFRPIESPDQRLSQKASVFAFKIGKKAFVIPFETMAGGWSGKAGKAKVFFFREPGDAIYRSTRAYLVEGLGKKGLKQSENGWFSSTHGSFDPESGRFSSSDLVLTPLPGIDTFWYTWYPYHPKTKILR